MSEVSGMSLEKWWELLDNESHLEGRKKHSKDIGF